MNNGTGGILGGRWTKSLVLLLLPIAMLADSRPSAQVMLQARARVLKATKEAKIYFLNSCNDGNVAEMLKDGVMICTGGYAVGRKITQRTMPW